VSTAEERTPAERIEAFHLAQAVNAQRDEDEREARRAAAEEERVLKRGAAILSAHLARKAELDALSAPRLLADFEERLESGVPRIRTGFPRLDARLGGGLPRPSLVVLGAGPKASKSTLTQKVVEHHVNSGGVAYVLDLENGPARFLRRTLCRRARLAPSQVAAALADRGAFSSRDEVERWQAAKAWFCSLGDRLHVEFRPGDLAARLEDVHRAAKDRPLLVVIDSLQKLPVPDMANRRAGTDEWLRLFERLRYDLDAVFWVVSEIRRGREGYRPGEDSFKESGSIEYSADLAMTMDRPAAEEDEDAVSTLTIQLDRDCEEDSLGAVASYAPVRPFYELEEREPAPRHPRGRRAAPAGKGEAAGAFLEQLLAGGPVQVADVIAQGERAGFSRATMYRAKGEVSCGECTLNLKKAWRLP
jgi:replicative DNA helicase